MQATNKSSKDLWDKRAVRGNFYKGELLYTITALPFYIKRRQLLLDLCKPIILKTGKILDFGCGDGWYIKYFNQLRPKQEGVCGLDISDEMVKVAQKYNPKSYIYVSKTGIKKHESYDLVYSFATFAHIDDKHIEKTYRNVADALNNNGIFMIFEQVAPFHYSGTTFQRRTIEEYKEIGLRNDLQIKQVYLLSFGAHRFFERYIAKHYVRLCNGREDYEKRLSANGHKLYRGLSRFFLSFDRKPVKIGVKSGWGNALIIYEKTGGNP